MEKWWRTVQPAHYSPNLTVEQAMAVCLAIEAEKEARRKRRRAPVPRSAERDVAAAED